MRLAGIIIACTGEGIKHYEGSKAFVKYAEWYIMHVNATVAYRAGILPNARAGMRHCILYASPDSRSASAAVVQTALYLK